MTPSLWLSFEYEVPKDWRTDESRHEDWSSVDPAVLHWTAFDVNLRLVARSSCSRVTLEIGGPLLSVSHELSRLATEIRAGEHRRMEVPGSGSFMVVERGGVAADGCVTIWIQDDPVRITTTLQEFQRATTKLKERAIADVLEVAPSLARNAAFVSIYR